MDDFDSFSFENDDEYPLIFHKKKKCGLWHRFVEKQRHSRNKLWSWMHKTDARAAIVWAIIMGIPIGIILAIIFAIPAAFIPEICTTTLHWGWLPGCGSYSHPKPIVSVLPSTNVTAVSATFHGSVDTKKFTHLQFFFYYGFISADRQHFTSLTPVSGSGSNVVFSINVSGLTPNMTYVFAAAVQTKGGRSLVSKTSLNMTTLPLPVVYIQEPTNVTTVSATLHGYVNTLNYTDLLSFFIYTHQESSWQTKLVPVNGSGNILSFSANMYALTPNTTYEVTAVVQTDNGVNAKSNKTLHLTTLPLPVVHTLPSTNITMSSVTLHGIVDTNNYIDLHSFFIYVPKDKSYHQLQTPLQPVNGSGDSIPFIANINGLTVNTTYVITAMVQTQKGQNVSSKSVYVTTLPILPNVYTQTPTIVTPTTALFHGYVNTKNFTHLLSFFYYGVKNFPHQTSTPRQPVLDSGKHISFTANVSELTPNTSYQVIAAVDTKIIEKPEQSNIIYNFTTLPLPIVYTGDPTNITALSATLHGSVSTQKNINLKSYFTYGTLGTSQLKQTPSVSIHGSGNISFVATIYGLTRNTTYMITAVVQTKQGLDIKSRKTLNMKTADVVPCVYTQAPTDVTAVSAILHGSVDTNTYTNLQSFFYFGPTSIPHQFKTPLLPVLGSGSHVLFTANVSKLTPNTVYMITAAVQTKQDLNVTSKTCFNMTTAALPVVYTQKSTDITTVSATLHGSVNTNSFSNLKYFFYYGPRGFPKQYHTFPIPLSGLGSNVLFAANVSGLSPNTTYTVTATVQTKEFKNELSKNTTDMTTLVPIGNVSSLDVGYYSAILQVQIHNRKGLTDLEVQFKYGLIDNPYQYSTAFYSIGENTTYSMKVFNLSPQIEYHLTAIMRSNNTKYKFTFLPTIMKTLSPPYGALIQLNGTAGCVGNISGECANVRGLVNMASLYVSEDKSTVYAAGLQVASGNTQKLGAIGVFGRNSTGALTQLLGKAGCIVGVQNQLGCETARGLSLVQSLVGTRDGRSVFSGGEYNNGPIIDVFYRKKTGELTQLPGESGCIMGANVVNGCGTAKGMAYTVYTIAESSDGKYVYASGGLLMTAAPVNGYITVFSRTAKEGALFLSGCYSSEMGTTCSYVPHLGVPRSVVVSEDGKSLYAGSTWHAGTGPSVVFYFIVTVWTRNVETGALTLSACLASEGKSLKPQGCTTIKGLSVNTDISLAMSKDGISVYLGARSFIGVFSRNIQTGSLTQLSAPQGCIVGVGNSNPDGCTSLDMLSGSTVGGIAIAGDGRNVYVSTSDLLGVFSRDTKTGALTELPKAAKCVAGVGGNNSKGCAIVRGIPYGNISPVVITEDGQSIYTGGTVMGVFSRYIGRASTQFE